MAHKISVSWWLYIFAIWALASGLASATQPEGILLGKQIKISAHAFNLNRKTGNYETKLVLSNSSKQKKTLYGPLTLVISGADQTGLNVANASGTTTTGLPYLTIALPDAGLIVGEKASGIALIVNNPGKKKFKLSYAVYGFFAPYQPDNKPPAMVQLVGVSSISGDSLSAEWLPTTDDQTPATQLLYTLHVSDTEGFTPSSATAKLTGTAITSGTIQHLSPASRYYVKVAAMDNQGLESWSNELTLTTSSIQFKRSAANVHVPLTGQAPQVTANSISYSSTTAPKVGEFLVGSTDGGYLRKVTAVNKQGNQITATTEPASLNQVFKDLDINTTIKLEPLPTSTPAQASIQSMALAARAKKNQRVVRWPQTGLTLIDNQVSTLPVMLPLAAAAVQNAQTTGVNGNQQTTTGIYTDFSGPVAVAITPGTASIFTVNALVSRPFIDQGVNIPLKVCSMRSLGVTHDDPAKRILLNNEQNPALRPQFGSMQPSPADQYASLTTQWSPDAKYVHDGGLPYYASYEVTVGEYAKTTGSTDCGSTLFNSGWRDKLTIKVPIYITMGDIPAMETKSLTFSSDLKVTDNLTFGVKPDFDIAARIRNFQLLDATLAVNADIEFQNELLIQGNAGAKLDLTQELLAPRKFVRVFTAGAVPIVVSGEFGMTLRVQGSATGTVNLGEVIRYAFPKTRFGLSYQNGQWTEVGNFQPAYQFTIKGDGNVGADLTLTLVPDLQIHFYDHASGRMLVEPYLYAQANIHGNFLYQDGSGKPLPYSQLPDYWFNDLQGGGGVDLKLYAGLHIFDHNIASYPPNVSVNDIDKFAQFAPLPKTAIAAIPKLSATTDYTTKPSAGNDTRAVLINGKFVELANPFKGLFGLTPDPFNDPYILFSKWTEPQVFTSQQGAKVKLDTTGPGAVWLNYVEPGTYRVRLSGESTLGYFVRLVAEDANLGKDQGISVEIVLTDNDNDGMVDQWESLWGVDDPAADPDQDLLSNLDEFKAGTDPTSANPVLTIHVYGDGTVTSNPVGVNGGVSNCAQGGGTCTGYFDASATNATVTLTATTANGSTLAGWSGPDASKCLEGINQTTCTLNLLGQPINISASFNSPNTITVDATTGSTGNGTVSSNPAGITCQTGSAVKCDFIFSNASGVILTATPDSNSSFGGWSGPDATQCQEGTTQLTCTLNLIGQPINIAAIFNGSCTIGSKGPAGGIIFYVSDPVACHGMEAAPVDQTPSTWGCWGYSTSKSYIWTFVGGTSMTIGTGAANTAAIIAACGTNGGAGNGNPDGVGTITNAAATASAYILNGYSDWYLPSMDELNQLYQHAGVVGGFTNNGYWSSTEYGYYYDYGSWYQYFANGVQYYYYKANILRVRAVRAF